MKWKGSWTRWKRSCSGDLLADVGKVINAGFVRKAAVYNAVYSIVRGKAKRGAAVVSLGERPAALTMYTLSG